VLFVGMLTGAYSSLFLATPWLVDLKMLDPRYKNHASRILSRRASAARAKAEGVEARPAPRGQRPRPAAAVEDDAQTQAQQEEDAYAASVTPRVGAKPAPRATGATNSGKRSGARPSANRPGGGSKRR
jgi:preprotein translocase subunit SecF